MLAGQSGDLLPIRRLPGPENWFTATRVLSMPVSWGRKPHEHQFSRWHSSCYRDRRHAPGCAHPGGGPSSRPHRRSSPRIQYQPARSDRAGGHRRRQVGRCELHGARRSRGCPRRRTRRRRRIRGVARLGLRRFHRFGRCCRNGVLGRGFAEDDPSVYFAQHRASPRHPGEAGRYDWLCRVGTHRNRRTGRGAGPKARFRIADTCRPHRGRTAIAPRRPRRPRCPRRRPRHRPARPWPMEVRRHHRSGSR